MGRQIGFYMTTDDELAFCGFLTQQASATIFLESSAANTPEVVTDWWEQHGPDMFALAIWRSDFKEPLTSLYVDKKKPVQHRVVVNRMDSEVIELSRSILRDNFLRPGRLWIETVRLNDAGEMEPKSPEFIKWYEKICRWIRKQSVSRHKGKYVLPGVVEFQANGGWLGS